MPERHKRAGTPLAAGDTFAVPLDDGRFGAVRVLRISHEYHRVAALVAVSAWIGGHVPDPGEPLLMEILRLQRGRPGGASYRRTREVWLRDRSLRLRQQSPGQ
jgi:hypothetical protein